MGNVNTQSYQNFPPQSDDLALMPAKVSPSLKRVAQTQVSGIQATATRVSVCWKRVSPHASVDMSNMNKRASITPDGGNKQLLAGVNRTIQQQDADGEALESTHTGPDGQVLADETAVRIPGKKALSVVLEIGFARMHNKAQNLQAEIKELKKDPGNIREVEKKEHQLTVLQAKIQANRSTYANLQKDETVGKRKFFDSNYHREYMSTAIKQLKTTELTGAVYQQMADKTNPGLVHARNITLKVKKDEHGLPNTYGLLRVGVMSDLTNGATNLEELRKIANGDTELKTNVLTNLQTRKASCKKGSPAEASLQMAIDQINNPSASLTKRTERMELMMLQYLSAQAERDVGKLTSLKTADTWSVVDVRLLSPKKDEIDQESGWVHNEANQLQDMKAIFEKFSGKTIVLDGKGPYIDDDGKVHLAINADGKELTLSATVLNISIQGQMENKGLQKDINEQAITALASHEKLNDQDDWKEMQALLNAGQSNGTVAEKAVTALVKAGITVSCGCLSAKDRTGWVVGRTMVKLVADSVPDIRKYLTKQILNSKSMASQILKDVTGWSFMKLDFKTMGSDATLSMKIRHTVGLVSECASHLIGKKLDALREKMAIRFSGLIALIPQ